MLVPISRLHRHHVSGDMSDPAQRRILQLRAMLEHVTQGIAMFDSNQQLVACNNRLKDVLNLTEDQYSCIQTFEGLIRILGARGDYGNRPEAIEAAIYEHIKALDESLAIERMLPDGRILEFRRDPLASGAFIVTYTDVTEHKHNEFLLKDSTRELRSIVEKTPVALAVISQKDGAFKHVNSQFCKLFGIKTSEAAEQKMLRSYLSDEDHGRILEASSDQKSVEFETEIVRADGNRFWTLIASVRFIFEWEPAVLVSFQDISDRRNAEVRLQEELKRRRAELNEARVLQFQLTPFPIRCTSDKFSILIDVVMEPAWEVGGDLVDHFHVTDTLLVIALGDVSNKGAGAALTMARAHSILRGLASRPDAEALFRSPEDAIRLINIALAKDNETCTFLTLFLASLDLSTGQLNYVRAGHIPPFLRRGNGSMQRLNSTGGPPLGLMEDAKHGSSLLRLCPGDQLLVVTDGITEAKDQGNAEFGELRLEEFLSTVVPGEARPLARVVKAVREFESGKPAFDDLAAIFMEVTDATAQ
jgi:PAS domain S-box-containing protein